MDLFRPESTIISVGRGKDAVLQVKDNNIDLVFLDLGLPDIDGVEVLRQIRSFSDVRVVIVSARTNPQIIENALELGADDFIVKPFDYHLLLNCLDAVAGKKVKIVGNR
jgi:two-component system, OmpR family, KDP operon response regulator KdpE